MYVVFLHKCLQGVVSVMSDNRISIRSKPASHRESDRTQLVVPLINAAYFNNSYFPRSVNSYNKLMESVMCISDFKAAL
jgi:hypothetical protein